MRDYRVDLDIESSDGNDLSYESLLEWYHKTYCLFTAAINEEVTFHYDGGTFIWRRVAPYDFVIDPPRVIDRAMRYEVLKRQKWRCNNCGEILKYRKRSKWDGKIAHIDHIHPYAERSSYRHGSTKINELSNLQALCPECNRSKATAVN
jgi:hypothetical protein